MSAQSDKHAPVLLQEAISALAVRPDGVYVDATFGRGGHSHAILEKLGAAGQLLVIDRDPDALQSARELAKHDRRVIACHGTFTMLERVTQQMKLEGCIDGILLDLGVSSPQLDNPARGFSFRASGPLDMRMNPEEGESAAQWLAYEEEAVIARVIRDYGEERFSRRIARAICERRTQTPLTDTADLAQLVAAAVPTRERGKHPATRTFQAIRIFINRELDELREVLAQTTRVLAHNGRVVVITFHSLEDRIVKRFLRATARPLVNAPGALGVHRFVPPRFARPYKSVTASAHERRTNPRARSARLRAAERR